jgi:hypothetical protein
VLKNGKSNVSLNEIFITWRDGRFDCPSFFCTMKYILFLSLIAIGYGFNCSVNTINEEANLNVMIDDWHQSASNADFDTYFSVTNEQFVFLGTAPGERWIKKDFMALCKPYFDKGKAWNFKPSNRIWNFSEDGKTAWFDESLDTWMEGCRGSGICVFEKDGWKLAHYNLTILIENEKIQDFISLRKQKTD